MRIISSVAFDIAQVRRSSEGEIRRLRVENHCCSMQALHQRQHPIHQSRHPICHDDGYAYAAVGTPF